jgi:hypothetical protein
LPGALGQQRLRDDALEHERELGADLRLLVAREDVDDAVDRLGRRVGVQRGEREVTRLGDGEAGVDRLQVAHLAHEDHVGILAQRVLEGVREGLGVGPDLALVDDAPWCRWMNSIGSSTVMMCPFRSRLILSIIAASVVDLPEPVGPVTSTRPRGFSAAWRSPAAG